jgi:hypothetical protein
VQENKKERRREIKVSVAAAIQLTSKETKTILSVLDK